MSTELSIFTPVSPNGFVSVLDVANLQNVASGNFHGISYFFEQMSLNSPSPSNISLTIRSSEWNKRHPKIVATPSISGTCTHLWILSGAVHVVRCISTADSRTERLCNYCQCLTVVTVSCTRMYPALLMSAGLPPLNSSQGEDASFEWEAGTVCDKWETACTVCDTSF